LTTVLGIYLFIVIGFIAKKKFEQIDSKTLVILSTYFLQPFLTLWGIMLIPLNRELILSPFVYLCIVFASFAFTYLLSRLFLKDKKEITIASLTPLIGNTGNLGIPLSYALFGEIGASIATLINLANIFFIYGFAVIFFSKAKYEFKEAIVKIVKIPIIWFGILALGLNVSGVKFNDEIMKILQMGAYASIVVQLLIFGTYIAQIKIKSVKTKLAVITVLNKFFLFPMIAFSVLKFLDLNPLYEKTIFLEVLTPLAVTNVNLSALFDLYPEEVSFLVLLTSFLFIFVVFLI